MGIPKFFRWLTRKYPMILHNVKKEEDLPPCDNLYLDLNGIVHNCIHGNSAQRHERVSKLTDLEEVWAACMRAIDEIVHTVKPKHTILLAVDGVAPRAKMNQQRARRFRSAKDSQKLHDSLIAAGKDLPDLFDSNAISPGTQFMADLCAQLHNFVKYKVNTDPLYKPLKVVLSDGTVPGEGEHKMMDYIRNLRLEKDYNPNTRHCFYGADADLIMLSLLTHEPHFYIIREEHVITKKKDGGVQRMELSVSNNYQLIHISLLREYFLLEYKPLEKKMKMKFDIERIIDDFIFFCFFIGNDFLPSLSALDLAEGSLDHLIVFYKTCLPTMENYITDNGTIHWDRAEPFMWVLGEHENETFKNRIDEMSSRFESKRSLVTFTQEQTYNASQLLQADNARAPEHMQNLYRTKLAQKKTKKYNSMTTVDDKKRYKRFVIQRKFKEDEKRLTEVEKQGRVGLESKLRKQFAEANPEDQEEKGINDIIKQLPDGYISDLRIEEIPDSAVSEVDIMIGDSNDGGSSASAQSPAPRELQRMTSTGGSSNNNSLLNQGLEEEAKTLTKGENCLEKENYDFMKDFATLYSADSTAAKRLYYNTKVHFDIDTAEGKKQKKAMLRKYIEGTQWVLYYYYKGAQHWRWYYPYHYAPIISDLGKNIVADFLDGQTVITKFEVDFNSPVNDRPYTPFQQLLSILPHKSMKLLPPAYGQIAKNELSEFFPEDFDCDLNGKTLSYEAIVLIPFCSELRVLEEEAKIITSGRVQLTEAEKLRNTISFGCFSYTYQANKKNPPQLKSTLTHMRPLAADMSQAIFEQDYEKVGQFSFESKLLPGVQMPSPGFPSFKYLNVTEIEYDQIVVNKRNFERAMVKIPQAIQESQPQQLETYVHTIAKANSKHIYIDFPQQIEAFPMFFEDKFTMYTLYGDAYSNKFEVRKEKQHRDEGQWLSEVNRVRFNLMQMGIFCPKDGTNVLVTCNRVQGVEYDTNENRYYQTYNEKPDVMPFSLFTQKRHPDHHLNVSPRINSSLNCLSKDQAFICLNTNLFGIMGNIAHVDHHKQIVKVKFDAEIEEAKVHDPFFAQRHLEQAMTHKKNEKRKNFFQDFEVEKMIKSPKNTVGRMTSSFLISYKNPENGEKMVVDIGLNIKNFSKKQHVPRYVRFVTNHDDLVINQLDTNHKHGYQKNHQRNMRPRWEYSAECVDIIKEYYNKFPDAFEAMKKCMEKNRAVHPLKEVYPSEGKSDSPEAVAYLKQILGWLEKLPISSLPFVEMGFDTLDMDLVGGLAIHREEVQDTYSNVKIVSRPQEFLRQFHIFSENFPFWCAPFYERQVSDFRAGNRVMNMNSRRREYIPFGLRGTVIGKTNDKVIVLFDEQYLAGGDLNQHCEQYRGGLVDPNYLLNITNKFENILRKDNGGMKMVQKFTEQKPGSDMQELQDLLAGCANANPQQRHQKPQQKPANSNYNATNEERKNNKQNQRKPVEKKQVGQAQEIKQEQEFQPPKEESKGNKARKQKDRQRKPKKEEPEAKSPADLNVMPALSFNSLKSSLSTNPDFMEVMSLMDKPELKQQISEGNVMMQPLAVKIPSEAQPASSEGLSASKLNAGAMEFVPISNPEKNETEKQE